MADYDISNIDRYVDIKATKTCPSCSGTDHQMHSSRLCKTKKKIPPPSEEGISQEKEQRGSKSKKGRGGVQFNDGISRPYVISV
eukprot:7046777-Ditylum_brightwellii.AAC.1